MIYFDHASTSFPKDPRVVAAVGAAMTGIAGSAHRGGHAGARRAERGLAEARELARRLLGARDGEVSFTLNATDALNLALKGVLRAGDEVVSTEAEHNSVRRPLRGLQARGGLRVRSVACDAAGRVRLEDLQAAVGPRTRWVVIGHASNVTGARQPVAELGRWLRGRPRPPGLIVDAAQTAGYRPLDEISDVAELIAVAGHKGPGGPAGTGFLWRRPGVRPTPWREGGTGNDSENPFQPSQELESGTPNLPGILGLAEAMRIRLEEDRLERLARAREDFAAEFLDLIREFPQVRCWGPEAGAREPVFPLRLRGRSVAESAVLAEMECDLVQRSGLHCAPGVHRAMGTAGEGTLRWSFGPRPGPEEIQQARDTLRVLTQETEGASQRAWEEKE